MASHPYISGPSNIIQMIGYLRKNFPTVVTSETVKKFSIAPNNESYVINALQFIGIIDEEGKRTTQGHDVFLLGDDAFPQAFEALIRQAYKNLFDLHADDAWTVSKRRLTSYFRTTDKTSEAIGGRQAGVFQAFRTIAGHENANEKPKKSSNNGSLKPRVGKPKAVSQKKLNSAETEEQRASSIGLKSPEGRRDMAMTVRIEINLPANGAQETYDAIFKSIRANLIDE